MHRTNRTEKLIYYQKNIDSPQTTNLPMKNRNIQSSVESNDDNRFE